MNHSMSDIDDVHRSRQFNNRENSGYETSRSGLDETYQTPRQSSVSDTEARTHRAFSGQLSSRSVVESMNPHVIRGGNLENGSFAASTTSYGYGYSSSGEGSDVFSEETFDTLEDLLSRFTITCHPAFAVKIRSRCGPLILGVDGVHGPLGESMASLVVKPKERKHWWRRLRVDTTGDIQLRSRKLTWWLFTLDLHGVVNPMHKTSDVSFRIATKWDLSRGEIKNKRQIALGEATEGRLHWNVNYNLPEVAGSFGSQQQEALTRDVHADVGFAHANISKVEIVAWPWRNNPKWEGLERWNVETKDGEESFIDSAPEKQKYNENKESNSVGLRFGPMDSLQAYTRRLKDAIFTKK